MGRAIRGLVIGFEGAMAKIKLETGLIFSWPRWEDCYRGTKLHIVWDYANNRPQEIHPNYGKRRLIHYEDHMDNHSDLIERYEQSDELEGLFQLGESYVPPEE